MSTKIDQFIGQEEEWNENCQYVYLAYILKPTIMLAFVKACKFKMSRTYYTLNFFFYRVMYDIVVIFWFSYVLYAYMFIKLFTLFILCAPATVLQLIVFLISVNPSLTRNRKLRFRQLKKEITTQEQNDAMWSSDSESDHDRYESATNMSAIEE